VLNQNGVSTIFKGDLMKGGTGEARKHDDGYFSMLPVRN
jgi:hypothetical protein